MACSTEKLPGRCRGGNCLEALQMLADDRLRGDEHERMLDEPAHVIAGFVLGPFERIGSQVEQLRQAKLHHRLRPDSQAVRLLLQEHRLPLIVAKAREVAVIGPVEEFAALVRALAGEEVALVVAVEMNLEVLAGGVVALQELVLDVRLAGGGHQRGGPILGREDVVDLGSGRHLAGPAHHRRNAIAAFPIGVLLAAERRGAAVGPGEGLGAVVGGVDDDRVIGDAEIVELLQDLADLSVVLHHAVRIEAEPGLALRLRLEPGPDVHAAWIEPDEEWLLVPVGPVDEIDRGLEKLPVDRLHALLGERAGILAFLFAPWTETRIVARRVGRRSRRIS